MAVKWAEDGQRFIFQYGEPLSEAQQNDARHAGVRKPEEIRLLYVPRVPQPDDGMLKEANDRLQLVTPNTGGMTLQYGIFIRLDCRGDRQLLVHECVHTSQYEQLGSVESFLRKYLEECMKFGYPQAPMELEAIRKAQRICA